MVSYLPYLLDCRKKDVLICSRPACLGAGIKGRECNAGAERNQRQIAWEHLTRNDAVSRHALAGDGTKRGDLKIEIVRLP